MSSPPTLKQIVDLIRQGQTETARNLLREYLAVYPDSADGWYLAARVALSKKQALAFINQALSRNPNHPQAKQALAKLSKSVPKQAQRSNRSRYVILIVGITGVCAVMFLVLVALGQRQGSSSELTSEDIPEVLQLPTVTCTQTASVTETPTASPTAIATITVTPSLTITSTTEAPTATTTLTRTPTPSPTASWPIVYQETFDSYEEWLPPISYAVGELFFGDALEIDIYEGGWRFWDYNYQRIFSNGVFEVEVRRISGRADADYGMTLRINEESGNLYNFLINSNGYARVQYCEEWCDTDSSVIPVRWSNAINTELGAVNNLKIVAIGDQFEFYVNDTLVTHFSDGRLHSGQVGLLAYSDDGSIHVVFDNLIVRSQTPPEISLSTPNIPTPSSISTPSSSLGSGSSCPYSNPTCSRLSSCAQAYACLPSNPRLDSDGDGIPCESLCD